MFHTYFTYVSHEFTCLGCRCLLPISVVFVPRQIWDLALMPWHLWGWWSTASDGACWTLRGGDANRDGHGWPWRLMQIGESNLGLPEDLAKSVEHSDRWVCYSLFMSGFVVLLFPVCFWRLLELPSVPACPRAGRSNCMHVPWQVRSSNMDQPLSTLYASIWSVCWFDSHRCVMCVWVYGGMLCCSNGVRSKWALESRWLSLRRRDALQHAKTI